MKKVRNVIQVLLLIVLPIVYFEIYRVVETYVLNKANIDLTFNNISTPIILCSLIVCFFTVILLEVGRSFGKGSFLKKIIIIVILLAHLIVSYLAPEIITYYMYTEVAASLMLIIVAIIVESLLDQIKAKITKNE